MSPDTSLGRTAFVGGGKMGEALIAGLVRAGSPADVAVVEPVAARAAELRERYGIATMTAVEAAVWADTVVVCVKPVDVGAVLDAVRDALGPDTLVVSIAAGLDTRFLAGRLAPGQPVVRVMPNTPAFVGAGMSVMSRGSSATDAHLDRAEQVLATVGRVLRVEEDQQDAVTAVSGSGPAYFFYLVEAMTDGGVRLGLSREVAMELAVQTAYGAGLMLRETGQDPATLRTNVTSPGGTTAAAIRSFDEQRVRDAVRVAMQACHDRSAEMGRDLA